LNGPPEESGRNLARIVRQALLESGKVELEGLGKFLRNANDEVRFLAAAKPRVFLAYVEEDLEPVLQIYRALSAKGFQPWLDKKKLLPGQNWPRAIETAIQLSDYFLACFSQRAVCKRGVFHSELRFALESAARVPLDEIFMIPVRLENCVVPARISSQIQYVDLFPDWEHGIRRVLSVIVEQEQLRQKKRLPLAG
jgi:TIR domain